MRKIILLLAIWFALAAATQAQVKITALPQATPVSTDIVPFVSDPAGTPVTKKTPLSDFFSVLTPGFIPSANRNGNGSKFQLFTGSSATNDCAKFDASGNLVTQGSSCAAAAPVQSVFGRTGAVVAAANDYNFNQLAGSVSTSQQPSTTVNSVVNDTNITGSISAQALQLGFTGSLSKARQHLATVYNDQANTFLDFAQTFRQNNIKATATDGVALANNTASDATNTVQEAPALHFTAHVWNTTATAADNAFDVRVRFIPTSGASPSARLSWWFSNNGGAYSEKGSLDSAGKYTATLFSGSGASLTNLDAAQLATNTVPTARLGSGSADSTKYLRGDSTWAATPVDNSASQSTLGSSFSITGTTGTFQDTGLSISLPSAGTYLVRADVRGAVTMSSGTNGYITAKLYNSTDAADVANSETLVALVFSTTGTQASASVEAVVTVAASKTIKLYASRSFDGALSNSQIPSDASGRTRLTYLKVSN